MTTYAIEGWSARDRQWDLGYAGDGTFESETEAEAYIPGLAEAYHCSEAEFRVVEMDANRNCTCDGHQQPPDRDDDERDE